MLTFEAAAEILNQRGDRTRRAKLYAASSRLADRARGTVAAAKLCDCSAGFRAIAAKAKRQLDAAHRLQEWAERRAGT